LIYLKTTVCIKVVEMFNTATELLGSTGDGSNPESCISCDPARPVCFDGCQQKIAKLYMECDGICLPTGYYYDVGAGKKHHCLKFNCRTIIYV
jgi:hypothetical protein